MIGYKKDRVLGAWNVVQLVECLLLAYVSPKAVNNACCILGPARTVLGRRLSLRFTDGWREAKPELTAWVWLEIMHPGSCTEGSGGSGMAPKDPARGPVMPFCRGGCSVSVARGRGTKLTPIRRAQASSRLTIDLGVLRPCSGHLFLD